MRPHGPLSVPLLYRGRRVECPVCGGRFRRFLGFHGRKGARCPACGSLERHRLTWLYLSRRLHLGSTHMSVLHFAPEPSLQARLSAMPGVTYVNGDLDPDRALEQMDITAIPRPDESFDLVLCSHVLEHVPDDRAAMREMLRVLKPGGLAVLQHPVDRRRAETYEDWSITGGRERRRAFNQEDHVRVYGADLRDRLATIGFRVSVEPYIETLDPALVARHGLKVEGEGPLAADDIYVCAKPGGP